MIPTLLEALGRLAESSIDADTPWILLIGPVGAVAIYWGLFQYYRNTGKSHAYERDTLIESRPITGDDRKINEVRGTRRNRIDGDNVGDYRQRVRRV